MNYKATIPMFLLSALPFGGVTVDQNGQSLASKSAPSAITTGECSPVIVGNDNKDITIVCPTTGLSAQQFRELQKSYVELLNATRQSGLKLDQVLQLAKEIATKTTQTQICLDNGQCVQISTQNLNIQQQYGAKAPAPKMVDLVIKELPISPPLPPFKTEPTDTPMDVSRKRGEYIQKLSEHDISTEHPGTSFIFRTDTVFQSPYFLIRCDRPCSVRWFLFGNIPATESHNTSIPNAVVIGGGVGFVSPNERISVGIRSIDFQPITASIEPLVM